MSIGAKSRLIYFSCPSPFLCVRVVFVRYNYIFIAVGRVGASSDFITQTVDWVDEENKRNQLMQYLPKFKGLTLIFVTRKKVRDTHQQSRDQHDCIVELESDSLLLYSSLLVSEC